MKKNLAIFYLLTFLMVALSPVGVHADACTEHQWGDWIEQWAASCAEDGSRYHACQICDTIGYESIPATGDHVWGEWSGLSQPSCTEEGLQHRSCRDCPKTETRSIPAIGHTWGKWIKTVDPTCGYTGLKERTCSACDETEESDIPKNQKHSWEKWKTTKRATALSNGKQTRLCPICYKKESRTIPKLKAKISLAKRSVTVKSGKSYVIKIKSKTYGDKVKKWKSSNKKVATVNSKGKVIGKREGTATITLVMRSNVRASCKVRVTRPKLVNIPKPIVTPDPQPAQPSSVWLSATGDKYHNIPDCGRMNPATARQVTLSEAVGQGFGPCSKCF